MARSSDGGSDGYSPAGAGSETTISLKGFKTQVHAQECLVFQANRGFETCRSQKLNRVGLAVLAEGSGCLRWHQVARVRSPFWPPLRVRTSCLTAAFYLSPDAGQRGFVRCRVGMA